MRLEPAIPDQASGGRSQARKPYVVSRPREKWSEAEHDLFVEALRLFGRSWKAIEAHIGTKTAVQIRSHAQKHFQKIQREKLIQEDTSGRPLPTDGGA
jgi:SHAQKYF class myb-like DNA-binding protein